MRDEIKVAVRRAKLKVSGPGKFDGGWFVAVTDDEGDRLRTTEEPISSWQQALSETVRHVTALALRQLRPEWSSRFCMFLASHHGGTPVARVTQILESSEHWHSDVLTDDMLDELEGKEEGEWEVEAWKPALDDRVRDEHDFASDPLDDAEPDPETLPVKLGGGWWLLSNGSKVQGETKARAQEQSIGREENDGADRDQTDRSMAGGEDEAP